MTIEPDAGPPLIGALMRMPVDAVRHRMLADLHAAGFTDLVMAHFAVLKYPGPQNLRPSDVATEAGMTKQATNYLLGQLEVCGYLVRRDDPDDRRSKRIHLTERGVAVRRTIRTTVLALEAELEAELGRAHFLQLRRLLVELNNCAFVRGPEGP
jgi:DNA-binding MarR family transcriptional regulator